MDRLPVQTLQKATVLAWFAEHYRCLRPGEPTTLAQAVPRRQLRRELNVVLHRCELPQIGERGSLWAEWFLPGVLHTDADGKYVMLVPLRRADSFRQTLLRLLGQLDGH